MEYNWVGFNGQDQVYTPSFKRTNKRISLLLDAKKYSEYRLLIEGRAKGGILINNRFVIDSGTQNDNYLSWSIDSISQVHGSDSLHLTFYEWDNIRTTVIESVESREGQPARDESLSLLMISQRQNKDLWIMLLILTGVLLGLGRSLFPKLFANIYDLREVMRVRFRENIFYEIKVFQSPNLLIYGLIGLLLVLFTSMNNLIYPYGGLSDIFLVITVFVIGFFASPIKYLIIRMASELFGLSDYARFHYMDYLRASLLIITSGIIASLAIIFGTSILRPEVLLIGLMIVFTILLFIKLLSNSVNKKLYLFSYICTTEIIPLLFIIKVFI